MSQERDAWGRELDLLMARHQCVVDPAQDREAAHRLARVEQKIRRVDEDCQLIDTMPPNPLTRNHT